MKQGILIIVVTLLMCTGVASADVTLYTPASGDATYSWNSKSGPIGYDVGETSAGIYLYFGGGYGNDHTIAIFEVPIASLVGQTVTGATLELQSLGFGTNYYYGSAVIGWLDVGSTVVTGDVVADGLGPAASNRPGGYTIYNSDLDNGAAQLWSFDVLTHVQADLAAGRAFSTFVLSGSRETYGSISTAESGMGPRIVVTAVPEPATMGLLGLGLAGLISRRMKRGKR